MFKVFLFVSDYYTLYDYLLLVYISFCCILFFLFIGTRLNESLILPRFNKKNESNSFDLLLKGIEQQTLNEKSVRLIFNKYNVNRRRNFFNQSISFKEYLESFIYYVREYDEDGTLTKSVNTIINPIIDKLNVEIPFPNVNERERRILSSINDIIMTSGSMDDNVKIAIKNHLDDLAMKLEENQFALEKSKKSNKLAIYGIVVSAIFGLISIILYFLK